MRRSAILAVAMLLATATVVQAGAFPKVSGTYAYELSGGTSTVTLDARANGLGSGTFTFERDNGVYMAGDLTCVFVDGQDAQVFGVVTYAENTEATFFRAAVHDSGLRGGVGDMAVSFAGPGEPPADCKLPLQSNLTAKFMVPIVSGNILIH